MLPLVRTKEELFSSTVINTYNLYKKQELNLVITNANFYDLSNAGMIDAFNGHDPVPASETTHIFYISILVLFIVSLIYSYLIVFNNFTADSFD